MSSTTYGWLTINDHDDLVENGLLTIGSVAVHTGRVERSKSFVLETQGGAEAEITVSQDAAGYIMEIDHFEDMYGNAVQYIDHEGGLYYIVGYANVNFLEITEDNGTSQTDLNNVTTGEVWTQGYTIIESNGAVHGGQLFEGVIPYGTDAQYTFRVPVNFVKTNETLEITFTITDDIHTLQQTVVQNGS